MVYEQPTKALHQTQTYPSGKMRKPSTQPCRLVDTLLLAEPYERCESRAEDFWGRDSEDFWRRDSEDRWRMS